MSKVLDSQQTMITRLKRGLFCTFAVLSASGCITTQPTVTEIVEKETLPAINTAKSGWDYLDQGAYAAAIPAFKIALHKEPENEKLLFGLAEAYRYTGQVERAEIFYAKLLGSADYKVNALTGIGYIKLSSHDNGNAFELFSRAVKEDDTTWKAWLGLASLRDLAKDWENADVAYKNALKSTNDRTVVLNNHGISMLARGDAAAARHYFDLALQISPNSERVKNNFDLAESDLDQNGKKSSYRHLRGKELARRLNNQGYVEMVRGNRAEAETYFVEAIDTHPSFYATAHKNLRTLRTLKKTKDD